MNNSLGSINFLTTNPMTDGFQQRAAALTSQRAAEVQADRAQFEMDEAHRTRAQAAQTDKALSEVVLSRTSPQAPAPASPGATVEPLPDQPGMELKPGGGMQAIGTRAGAVPAVVAPHATPAPQQAGQRSLYTDAAHKMALAGRGTKAMQLLEIQQKQQDQNEEMTIKALGDPNFDPQVFKYWQQKSGLQLPPEVVQSAEARGNFARAMDIAKQNYKDDPAQGKVFAEAFMATPGDFQAKLQTASLKAGPPRTKPHWTATTVMQNGQQVLAFYDTNSGSVKVTDHQKPENAYGTQFLTDPESGEAYSLAPGSTQARPITKPDGTTFTGTKMGGPGKGQGRPVKIGAISGNLYPEGHNGPGANGEDVVTLPPAEATKLAVARGNNGSREKIAELNGQFGIEKQHVRNEGALAVTDARGGWSSALQDQKGQNSLAVQSLRNEGSVAAAKARGAAGGKGGGSVYEQKRTAWLSLHPGDEQGALDYAGGRRKLGPAEEQKMASQIAKNEFSGAFNVKPEQVAARTTEILTGWRQGGGPAQATTPTAPAQAGAPAPAQTPPVVPATTNGQNAPAPSAMPPAPANLKGRKLQWSQSRKAFRDAATGEVFDANGNLMGK
jgi:hypothetical protein